MTSRIGKEIAKRRGRPIEHQQPVLFPLGEAISPSEFKDASTSAHPRQLLPDRPLLSPEIGSWRRLYSAAASAGFTSGKNAANSPTTSPIRLESASEETT